MDYYSDNSVPPSPMLPTTGTPSPVLPTYARGGSAKGLIKAHFGPQELHEMDELQGGPEYDRVSGLKVYRKLEKKLSHLLSDPHTREIVIEHIRTHKSHGGHVDPFHARINREEHMGRNGDTKMALITQDLMHLLDEVAGHRPRNPNTGYPEYWSLGGFFGGLSRPNTAQMAQSMQKGIGSLLGKGATMASKIGSTLSPFAKSTANLAKNTAKSIVGAAPEGGWGKALTGSAMSGLANAAAAKLGGANWGDAAKIGALAGSSGFNSPGARATQAALQSSLQGGNTKNALLSGLSAGASGYDTNAGRGLTAAANMGLQGGDMKKMALAGLGGATAGMNNPLAKGIGTASHAYLGGHNTQDSLLHGALAGLNAAQNQNTDQNPIIEEGQEDSMQEPQQHLAHGGGVYYY